MDTYFDVFIHIKCCVCARATIYVALVLSGRHRCRRSRRRSYIEIHIICKSVLDFDSPPYVVHPIDKLNVNKCVAPFFFSFRVSDIQNSWNDQLQYNRAGIRKTWPAPTILCTQHIQNTYSNWLSIVAIYAYRHQVTIPPKLMDGRAKTLVFVDSIESFLIRFSFWGYFSHMENPRTTFCVDFSNAKCTRAQHIQLYTIKRWNSENMKQF